MDIRKPIFTKDGRKVRLLGTYMHYWSGRPPCEVVVGVIPSQIAGCEELWEFDLATCTSINSIGEDGRPIKLMNAEGRIKCLEVELEDAKKTVDSILRGIEDIKKAL